MVHAIKCEKFFYGQIKNGYKRFEVRKDDRHYAVGDVLALNELDPSKTEYTGHSLLVRVTSVLRDERFLQKGYVIMGIERLGIISDFSLNAPEMEIYGGNGNDEERL